MYACLLFQLGVKYFFCTEKTKKITFSNRLFLPSVGALAKAISYASGINPVCITKPNPYILEILHKKFNWSKNETLIIGDIIENDIEMAKNF